MKNKQGDKSGKENKELRRQIEILKAQLKSAGGDVYHEPSFSQENKSTTIDKVKTQISNGNNVNISKEVMFDNSSYMKKDLIRTGILSLIIFSVIFGAYFSGKF